MRFSWDLKNIILFDKIRGERNPKRWHTDWMESVGSPLCTTPLLKLGNKTLQTLKASRIPTLWLIPNLCFTDGIKVEVAEGRKSTIWQIHPIIGRNAGKETSTKFTTSENVAVFSVVFRMDLSFFTAKAFRFLEIKTSLVPFCNYYRFWVMLHKSGPTRGRTLFTMAHWLKCEKLFKCGE